MSDPLLLPIETAAEKKLGRVRSADEMTAAARPVEAPP
jgi:hypothetical protein